MKKRTVIGIERVAGMGHLYLNVNLIESIGDEPGQDSECRITMLSGTAWDVKGSCIEILAQINRALK